MSSVDEWAEIDEQDIRRLASEPSFERGLQYHLHDAILDMHRQGNELHATCLGSGDNLYTVWVQLDANGIRDYSCTCPYMGGGACKHVVALLLDWIHSPEATRRLASVDDVLAQRSREELIWLIQEMLKRQPELRHLLELPLQTSSAPLDVAALGDQVRGLFRREQSAYSAAADLRLLYDRAERWMRAADWPAAGTLCQIVIKEGAAVYPHIYDDRGEIALLLTRYVQGLDLCLDAPGIDASTRRKWLDALFDIWLADVEMGGIDLGYPAPDALLQHATAHEWQHIATRIREQVTAARAQPHSDWKRETLIEMLVQGETLHGSKARPEAIVLELGTPRQRAFLLLGQGHVEQAVQLAEQHFERLPGLVTEFADALAAAGAVQAARTYLAGQLGDKPNTHYLSWLAAHEEEPAAALVWYRRLFEAAPSLDTYRHARAHAEPIGRWPQVRQDLIAHASAGQWHNVLVEIAIDEDDLHWALALLPQVHYRYSYYALQVAELAEPTEPRAALEVYLSLIEKTIGERSRPSYQAAATLLGRVRGLYTRLHAPLDWIEYLADLRRRYRRLRALQDELNRAGL